MGDCHSCQYTDVSFLDQGQLANVCSVLPPSAFDIQNESCTFLKTSRDFIRHIALAASKRHHVLEKTFHLLSFANVNCFDTKSFQFGLGDECCSGMLLHESKALISRPQESQMSQRERKCCKVFCQGSSEPNMSKNVSAIDKAARKPHLSSVSKQMGQA